MSDKHGYKSKIFWIESKSTSRLKKNEKRCNIHIRVVMMKPPKPMLLGNLRRFYTHQEKTPCAKTSKQFRNTTKPWLPHSSNKQPRQQQRRPTEAAKQVKQEIRPLIRKIV